MQKGLMKPLLLKKPVILNGGPWREGSLLASSSSGAQTECQERFL